MHAYMPGCECGGGVVIDLSGWLTPPILHFHFPSPQNARRLERPELREDITAQVNHQHR
jgi:hypothetical protein